MNRLMRLAWAAACVASLTVSAGCTHGPVQDHSRFISAKLTPDETVVLTFADFSYRPATGAAAFPDGGVPEYVTDRNVIAVFDVPTGKARLLHAEANTEFQPGHGRYHVVDVHEPTVLLTQGGQLRGPFALETRHWLADLRTGSLTRIDLAGELAQRDRAVATVQLLDSKGTLLLISPSLAEAEQHTHWRRVSTVVPELWVRYPNADYVRVAATRHLERADAEHVVYWMPSTRQFSAFDLATRSTSTLSDYRPAPRPTVTHAVQPTTDGQRLRLGNEREGAWQYEDLSVTHEMLR